MFQLKPRLTGRQGVMNDSNIKTVSNIGAAREVNEHLQSDMMFEKRVKNINNPHEAST